ncbi:unnamed protein product [marine sediment metagenome]|uniref:Uncharacterized protein n=1 Tax=marine sediment metagenome TaxID=412755 RepID=X1RJG2_9ZZZZ
MVLREAARVAKKKVVFTVPDEGHWTPDHLPLKTLDDLIIALSGIGEAKVVLGNVNAPISGAFVTPSFSISPQNQLQPS